MRLIDADTLMPNAEYKGANCFVSAYDIVNAPTIDPVIHGRWIKISKGEWKCSNCGNWWSFDDSMHIDGCYKYCPDCGAKMDETQKKHCDDCQQFDCYGCEYAERKTDG